MRSITVIAGLVLVVSLSTPALAKDMEDKWGFGGSVRLGPVQNIGAPTATIDGIYWLGPIGLEGRIGFNLSAPEGADAQFGFSGGFGFIYNFVDLDDVNVGVGADLDGRVFAAGQGTTRVGIGFGFPLRAEYFFSDNFAINGKVGIGFDIATDPTVFNFGTASAGFLGAFGFIIYMN